MDAESLLTLLVTLFGAGGVVTVLIKGLTDAHKETVQQMTDAITRGEQAVVRAETRANKWENFALDTFASLRTTVSGFGQVAEAVTNAAHE